MEITISNFGDAAAKKVTLAGKLDIIGARAIEPHLKEVAESRSDIVVDMVGVSFIMSTGIHQLIMAARAVAQGGGRLVLLDPAPMVTDVLLKCGVQMILPIVRSEDEARAALGRAGA